MLPREVFDRVDKLAAPRLVEYWEQDPCDIPPEWDEEAELLTPEGANLSSRRTRPKDLGVTIEAQFEVGEYQVVVLSAKLA